MQSFASWTALPPPLPPPSASLMKLCLQPPSSSPPPRAPLSAWTPCPLSAPSPGFLFLLLFLLLLFLLVLLCFRVPLQQRRHGGVRGLRVFLSVADGLVFSTGNIEYSCPVASKCEITKRRRKACQACRFQKCLQAGMMREEPAPLSATQDESTNESSLSTVLTLCDLLNRQLLLLIGWAKQIPGFAALSLVDQMLLLQSGWMEALLVGVAWRSQGEELVFAENLRLDEAQCRAAGLGDLYEALRHLSTKYQAMNLSPEEAVMLKAMALANTAAAGRPAGALQELQASRAGGPRGGRLLMSLPLLRQTADRAVRNLLRIHREQRVPLHRLLLEMML
ncbi:hypothetical protein F7725_021240 [Dissostichus mawsoni]|uniref:Uncharacterized protein n=1 Tax=Dissostichus mawsoni TaxID=36200 RepID=A0A7J5YFG9_DISMA|nr:hypothetical protein F7725_021240 [Dissostichus mawsoni]